MLEALRVLLLTAHLLLVDVAMAGPLFCIWLDWREARSADPGADRIAQRLARLSLHSFLGAIILGAGLLTYRWWVDDRAYFSAIEVIPVSRLVFGAAELLFYFVCMVAYLALWNRWKRRRWLHRLLALAASSNLLLHFPALFAIISVVSNRPQLWGEVLDRAGYQQLLLDGEVLSRVMHVWLASLAVTGVVVMWLAWHDSAQEKTAPDASAAGPPIARRAALIALVSSLAQVPSGMWAAWQMPTSLRGNLLGDDLTAMALFLLAVLLAVGLMHTLAAVAMGDDEPRLVRRSALIVLLVTLAMVSTRARLAAAAPAREQITRRGDLDGQALVDQASLTPTTGLPRPKVAFQ